ncbi:hypothetical protein LguiB_004785 [Lonicera macranthoides]
MSSHFLFLVSIISVYKLVCAEPVVPCYFIFGDSLVDNGNNNDLNTTAKCNFPPYGIDFLQGPTGRFSNGRNIADFIAEYLGFDGYIKPFANATGEDILKGVNYGSGAAGIREESGQQMGDRISLSKQLRHHRITMSRIAILLGNKRLAKEYLSKCIYTIGMGSNDYINNYFMPKYYPTSFLYTPDQYATALVKKYSQQITTLYKYGAKKVGIFGLGDIGCTPFELQMYGTDGSSPCVEKIGNAVQYFNIRLHRLVDELDNKFTDAKFIFINQTSSADSSSLGFSVLNEPCCIVSNYTGKGQCAANTTPCSDRDKYVYWDAFHPTETANKLLGGAAYLALFPLYSLPVDIQGHGDGEKYVSSV